MRDTLLALHREKHLWSGVDPEVGPSLDKLLASGLRLGVVSNSDGRADEALIAADIRDRFEFVVDSQLVGFEKPDPRIFDFAFRQFGFGPQHVTYVGDLYEVDVVGARRAKTGCDPAGSVGEAPGQGCPYRGEYQRGYRSAAAGRNRFTH